MAGNEKEIRQTEVVKDSPITTWNYGNLPNNFKPASETDKVGERCGNCTYFDAGYCHKWGEYVSLVMWCADWGDHEY